MNELYYFLYACIVVIVSYALMVRRRRLALINLPHSKALIISLSLGLFSLSYMLTFGIYYPKL